jgi:hypothetical protein
MEPAIDQQQQQQPDVGLVQQLLLRALCSGHRCILGAVHAAAVDDGVSASIDMRNRIAQQLRASCAGVRST